MMNKRVKLVMDSLGLTSKHGLVWIALARVETGTPLALARTTKLNRTSIYRYLEDLRSVGLVDVIMAGAKKSLYRAVDAEKMELVIVRQETSLSQLRANIPLLARELKREPRGTESEVVYYRGVQGLKQLLWNVVASGKEYMGLGYENWNTSVGKRFAEKLRAKNVETGAKSRELLNDDGSEPAYTDLKMSYQQVYRHRVIDKAILEIKHDTYIYGDVFAYYYHYQGEYFGVEIHNMQIARTERQIFEILWKMGA